MIGEYVRIRLRTELVQQRRRALDISEEEGDCAGRKLGAHAEIMRGSRIADKVARSSDIPAGSPSEHLTRHAGHEDRW